MIERTIWIVVLLLLASSCSVLWIHNQTNYDAIARQHILSAETFAAIAHLIKKDDSDQALDLAESAVRNHRALFEQEDDLRANGLFFPPRLPKDALTRMVMVEEAIAGDSYYRDAICDAGNYGRSVCDRLADRQRRLSR